MRGVTASRLRIESSLGPENKKCHKFIKRERKTYLFISLRTNSNDITICFMQLRIVDMLPSTKRDKGRVEFSEFVEEWSRIFSQRMPRRNTVDKDGAEEGGPEKTKDDQDCQKVVVYMRKIEYC